jgi:autotransporter-associated beta strand protein
MHSPSKNRFAAIAIAALSVSMYGQSFAHAEGAASLTASDSSGSSSFINPSNWSPSGAPAAGTNYFNAGFILRTPTSGSSYSFGGDSLTVSDGGSLLFKGPGGGIINVNSLTLDGAVFNSGSASTNTAVLTGSITVTANGATIYNDPISLNGNLVGAGPVYFGAAGSGTPTVTLNGNNSAYTGTININGSTVNIGATTSPLGANARVVFGGASGVAGTLNINGINTSASSLANQAYANTSTAVGTLVAGSNSVFHFASFPTGVLVGQNVTSTAGGTNILSVDATTGDIGLFTSPGAGATTFTFSGAAATPSSQLITNNGATPATFTFAGGTSTSTFGGGIQNGSSLMTLNVASGQLNLSNVGTGTANVNVAAGAVLNYSLTNSVGLGYGTTTFSGGGQLQVSGTGTLSFTPGGVTTLAYSGGAQINVQGGALIMGNYNSSVSSSANLASLNIATGALVDGYQSNVQFDALTGGGTFQAGYYGNRTLTLGANNGSGVFSGTIQSNGVGGTAASVNLVKLGNGTQTFTGTVNLSGDYGSNTLQVQGGTASANSVLNLNVASASLIGYEGAAPYNGGINIGSTSTTDVAVLNQTGGTVYGTFNIGTSGTGTYNLSGGTAIAGGTVSVATNGSGTSNTGTVNISGTGALNLWNSASLQLGLYYGRLATINQSGGTVTFYSDAGNTPGGSGALAFNGANQNSAYNLTGGTLVLPGISWRASGGGAGGGNGTLNLAGGILQPTSGFSVPIGTSNGKPEIVIAAGGSGSIANSGANINTYGASVNFNAPISHGGANTIDGGLNVNDTAATPGTLTLTAANTYTGPTIVTRGTLALSGSGNVNTSPTIITLPGGTFDVSALSTYSPISGQTLQGTGNVNGPVTATTGFITGGTAASPGTLTFNNVLTLAGGTTLFNLATTSGGASSLINASGGLTVSSASSLSLQFATIPSSTQTYTLFDYTGTALNSAAQAMLGITSNAGARNLTLSFVSGAVDVTYVPGPAGAATLNWNATSSGAAWDNHTSANWYNPSFSSTSKFYGGDNVTFNDTAGLDKAVTINQAVSPGSLTVSSNGNNYTFSGTGKITGTTGLIKNGTSTLTIATANDFSGATQINGGTIVALNSAGAATGTGSTTIASNASLIVGDNATAGAGNLAGSINNAGSLVINRPDAFTLPANVSGTGGVTFSGSGTTTIGGSLSYSGTTAITNGEVLGGAGGSFSPASTVSLASSATIDVNGTTQTVGGLAGPGTVSLNGGALTFGSGGDANFAGTINGSGGGLGYSGTGTVSLTGSLTYTGPTTVNNGTLILSPAGGATLGGSSPFSGPNFEVAPNATNVGSVVIASGVTINASTFGVADTNAGGVGSVTMTGGTVNVNQLDLAQNGAGASAVFNISGGTLNVAGNGGPGIVMALNNGTSSAMNISGAAVVNLENNSTIRFGTYYGRPAEITQTGGTVTFYSDGGSSPGGSGGFALGGGSTATSYYRLSGGELVLPQFTYVGQAVNNNYGATAAIYFNGGTLQTPSGTSTLFNESAKTLNPTTGQWYAFASAGGAIIDVDGQSVNFNLPLQHDPALGGNVDGGLTVNDTAGGGTLTLSAANTFTGPVNVNSTNLVVTTPLVPVTGSLVVTGTGASVALNAAPGGTAPVVIGQFNQVSVAAGAAVTVAQTDRTQNVPTVLVANSLSITGGNLDLGDNDAILHGTTEAAVDALVASWYSGGSLNGLGLASSSASANPLTSLGVITNADGQGGALYTTFDGVPVSSADVLVKYTYLGDTELRGFVDANDLANTLAGMSGGLTGWVNGDFNYDGVVDQADVNLLLNSLASQTTNFGYGGGPSGAVPEPTALTLGLLTIPALSRRRR